MKPSIRLLVPSLLLVFSAGIGNATAQTVISLCQPCIQDYQACLASGQSQSECQSEELACCMSQTGSTTTALGKVDRKPRPKKV